MMTLRQWLEKHSIKQTEFAEIVTKDTPHRPLKQPTLTYWLEKEVPPRRTAQVVRLTNGEVTAEEATPSSYQ